MLLITHLSNLWYVIRRSIYDAFLSRCVRNQAPNATRQKRQSSALSQCPMAIGELPLNVIGCVTVRHAISEASVTASMFIAFSYLHCLIPRWGSEICNGRRHHCSFIEVQRLLETRPQKYWLCKWSMSHVRQILIPRNSTTQCAKVEAARMPVDVYWCSKAEVGAEYAPSQRSRTRGGKKSDGEWISNLHFAYGLPRGVPLRHYTRSRWTWCLGHYPQHRLATPAPCSQKVGSHRTFFESISKIHSVRCSTTCT
jgi:hypothetical protein